MYIYVYMYIYIYTHIYIYVYIHMHTYINYGQIDRLTQRYIYTLIHSIGAYHTPPPLHPPHLPHHPSAPP